MKPGKRKVHFLLGDGREMVEEYNLDTNVLTRRTWREKGKLGQNVGWTVEVGDPEPKQEESLAISGIRESSNAVCCINLIYSIEMQIDTFQQVAYKHFFFLLAVHNEEDNKNFTGVENKESAIP